MHPRVDRGHNHPFSSEITPQAVYKARRQWIQGLAAVAAGMVLPVSPAMAQSARPGKLAALPGGRSAVAGAQCTRPHIARDTPCPRPISPRWFLVSTSCKA